VLLEAPDRPRRRALTAARAAIPVTVPATAAAVAAPALARLARIGFLTLPNYSAIALVNALEACRMANYVTLAEDYRYAVVTLDGAAAAASNGLSLTPTVRIAEAGPFDLVFVCGGVSVRHAVERPLSDALRRLARRGVALGGLCTGTFALAEAGLLDGYRAAIHWENLTAIREEFAGVAFTEELFVVDRDRLTCTGGVAPLELMLTLIEARHGKPVAAKVSDQFMVERPRGGGDRQPLPLPSRIEHLHPALARAARMMDTAIERPLTVADVAAGVGLSPRQLERLFRRHLGTSPAEFSLGRRLVHARELLRQTPMSVTDVGLACGFQSAAHFSTAYRRHFGRSPREERAA
jgi:transcriptional regulator GlxA family with amidase domain